MIFQVHRFPEISLYGFAVYPRAGGPAFFGINRDHGVWRLRLGRKTYGG